MPAQYSMNSILKIECCTPLLVFCVLLYNVTIFNILRLDHSYDLVQYLQIMFLQPFLVSDLVHAFMWCSCSSAKWTFALVSLRVFCDLSFVCLVPCLQQAKKAQRRQFDQTTRRSFRCFRKTGWRVSCKERVFHLHNAFPFLYIV